MSGLRGRHRVAFQANTPLLGLRGSILCVVAVQRFLVCPDRGRWSVFSPSQAASSNIARCGCANDWRLTVHFMQNVADFLGGFDATCLSFPQCLMTGSLRCGIFAWLRRSFFSRALPVGFCPRNRAMAPGRQGKRQS